MYRRNRNARLLTGGIVGALPVTTPGDEHWDDVSLLVRGDTLTDLSGNNTPVANNGAAAGDTSPVKFASGSMSFDGSNDYINAGSTDLLDFAGGDWTIEAWVYLPDLSPAYQMVSCAGGPYLAWNNTDGLAWQLYIRPTTIHFTYNTASDKNAFSGTHGMSINTWHHVAVSRDGSTFRLFVDGSQVASNTGTPSAPSATDRTLIGIGNNTSADPYKGNIEDFRITKGVARYTANFTPPQASLPTNAPVVGRRGVGSVPPALAVDTFATLDTNFRGGLTGEQVTENDLKYYCPAGSENYVAATLSKTTGKWYFECLYDGSTNNSGHGIVGWTYDDISQATTTSTNPHDLSYGGMLLFDGRVRINAVATTTLQTTSANDVFGVAFDADTREIWFSVNGTWVEGDPGAGTAASSYGSLTSGKTYIPFIGHFSASTASNRKTQAILNFGQDADFAGQKNPSTTYTDANGLGEFYYEPPAGFVGLYTTTTVGTGTLRTRGYLGAAPAGSVGMLTLYDRYIDNLT